MINKFLLIILIAISFSSCATEWTSKEQDNFMKNCKSIAPNSEDIDRICACGLQKAMDKFKTYDIAKKNISQMKTEEWEDFFEECN